MDEKDLNRVIVRSFNEGDFGYKIPDDASSFTATAKKPFDYFGNTGDFVVFGESKLIKGVYAFNFKRLADHQLHALRHISRVRRNNPSVPVYSVVSIGLWRSRQYFYVLFFDIDLIWSLMTQDNGSRRSIRGKELSALIEHSPDYVFHVKRGLIYDIGELPRRIITSETFKNVRL